LDTATQAFSIYFSSRIQYEATCVMPMSATLLTSNSNIKGRQKLKLHLLGDK